VQDTSIVDWPEKAQFGDVVEVTVGVEVGVGLGVTIGVAVGAIVASAVGVGIKPGVEARVGVDIPLLTVTFSVALPEKEPF
jgi:hypothetical protein